MKNIRVLGAVALIPVASLLTGCAVYPMGPQMGYPAPYSGYQQPQGVVMQGAPYTGYQQPQGVVQGPAYYGVPYGGYPGGYYGGAYGYYGGFPQLYLSVPFFLGGYRGDGGFRGHGDHSMQRRRSN